MSSFQSLLSQSAGATTESVVRTKVTTVTGDSGTSSNAYLLFNTKDRAGEDHPVNFPRATAGSIAGLEYIEALPGTGLALRVSKTSAAAGTTVAVQDGFFTPMVAKVKADDDPAVLHAKMPDLKTNDAAGAAPAGLEDGDLYFQTLTIGTQEYDFLCKKPNAGNA